MKLIRDHYITGFGVYLNDLRFLLTDRVRKVNKFQNDYIPGINKKDLIRLNIKKTKTINIKQMLERLHRHGSF